MNQSSHGVLISATHGVIDEVEGTAARVLFGEDGEQVSLIPLKDIPEEARHAGVYVQLQLYHHGPGDVRRRLLIIQPPRMSREDCKPRR